MSPTSSPSWKARRSPVAVTSPITAWFSSHLRQTAATSSGRDVTQTIRSWLSEIMISHGSRSASRKGTRSSSTSTPAPSRAISASAEARPAAPQSWSDSTSPCSTSSWLASISFLPVKGSPIWTLGRLSASSSPSSWLARTLAPPIPSRPVVARKDSDAHRVDQAVAGIALVEDRFAAHGRHTHAISVVPDAREGALEHPVRLGETQAVEERDRPRAHRDHVAQDSADSGRRPLKRLNRGRMVVALDLERDGLSVAEIEHARVLPGALEHALALRRKPLQEPRRVLVAAVLRPEEREDGQLEVVRVALEQLADAVELLVRKAECAVQRLLDDLQSLSIDAATDSFRAYVLG